MVIAPDGALLTPPPSLPILPGTTAQALFEVARATRLGVSASRRYRIADLLAAQGVWLLSSVTLAARVHTLDGVPLPAVADGGRGGRDWSTPRSRVDR